MILYKKIYNQKNLTSQESVPPSRYPAQMKMSGICSLKSQLYSCKWFLLTFCWSLPIHRDKGSSFLISTISKTGCWRCSWSRGPWAACWGGIHNYNCDKENGDNGNGKYVGGNNDNGVNGDWWSRHCYRLLESTGDLEVRVVRAVPTSLGNTSVR